MPWRPLLKRHPGRPNPLRRRSLSLVCRRSGGDDRSATTPGLRQTPAPLGARPGLMLRRWGRRRSAATVSSSKTRRSINPCIATSGAKSFDNRLGFVYYFDHTSTMRFSRETYNRLVGLNQYGGDKNDQDISPAEAQSCWDPVLGAKMGIDTLHREVPQVSIIQGFMSDEVFVRTSSREGGHDNSRLTKRRTEDPAGAQRPIKGRGRARHHGDASAQPTKPTVFGQARKGS